MNDQLIEQWIAGELDAVAEADLRQRMLVDPELAAEAETHARIDRALRALDDVPAERAIAHAVLARMAQRQASSSLVGPGRPHRHRSPGGRPLRPVFRRALPIGLILVLIVSAAVLGVRQANSADLPRASSDARGGVRIVAGSTLDSGSGTVDLRWDDGSTAQLAPMGRLRIAEPSEHGKAMTLDQGLLACAVKPQPIDRPWTVSTPHVVVTVIGTAFHLDVDVTGTRVAVDSGVVRVQRTADGSTRELRAGDDLLIKPVAVDPPTVTRRQILRIDREAMVRAGQFQNAPHGRQKMGINDHLWIKDSPGQGDDREVFVRFPLPTSSDGLQRATLRVRAKVVQQPSIAIDVFAVTQPWDSRSITWATRPASRMLGTVALVEEQDADLDITETVRAAIADGRSLSLRLAAQKQGPIESLVRIRGASHGEDSGLSLMLEWGGD